MIGADIFLVIYSVRCNDYRRVRGVRLKNNIYKNVLVWMNCFGHFRLELFPCAGEGVGGEVSLGLKKYRGNGVKNSGDKCY
ncbi:MAG: hypothetical protein COA36_13440 [Desulfotalea sp.]|nr:MAG: hypothetical protein COA36_13440 [Desulfotalea sp.]